MGRAELWHPVFLVFDLHCAMFISFGLTRHRLEKARFPTRNRRLAVGRGPSIHLSIFCNARFKDGAHWSDRFATGLPCYGCARNSWFMVVTILTPDEFSSNHEMTNLALTLNWNVAPKQDLITKYVTTKAWRQSRLTSISFNFFNKVRA